MKKKIVLNRCLDFEKLIFRYETKYDAENVKSVLIGYLDRHCETTWRENSGQSPRDAKGSALEMARLPWRS